MAFLEGDGTIPAFSKQHLMEYYVISSAVYQEEKRLQDELENQEREKENAYLKSIVHIIHKQGIFAKSKKHQFATLSLIREYLGLEPTSFDTSSSLNSSKRSCIIF